MEPVVMSRARLASSEEALANGGVPMLLGSSTKPSTLHVKNTFVDVSLYTPEPSAYKGDRGLTCPAKLSKALSFAETPEPAASQFANLACSSSGGGACAVETPYMIAEGCTPSPEQQTWELQRSRLPCRIAPLSFDAPPSLAAAQKVDTTFWPTLFEHDAVNASLPQVSHLLPPPPMHEARIEERGGREEASDDEDEEDEDDESPGGAIVVCKDAPLPPPGALHPSLGSERHAMGTCRRCCFFPRGRCQNGYGCEFCHYEHDKRKRKNKAKARGEIGTIRLAPWQRMPAAPYAYPGTAYPGAVPAQHPALMYQPPHSLGGYPLSPCGSFAAGVPGMPGHPLMPAQGGMISPGHGACGARAAYAARGNMTMHLQAQAQVAAHQAQGFQASLVAAQVAHQQAAAAQQVAVGGSGVIQLGEAVSQSAVPMAAYAQMVQPEYVDPSCGVAVPPPPAWSPSVPQGMPMAPMGWSGL